MNIPSPEGSPTVQRARQGSGIRRGLQQLQQQEQQQQQQQLQHQPAPPTHDLPPLERHTVDISLAEPNSQQQQHQQRQSSHPRRLKPVPGVARHRLGAASSINVSSEEKKSPSARSLGNLSRSFSSRHWLLDSEFGVSIEEEGERSAESEEETDDGVGRTSFSPPSLSSSHPGNDRFPTNASLNADAISADGSRRKVGPDAPLLGGSGSYSGNETTTALRARKKKPHLKRVFGIASPTGDDPGNESVEWFVFRWALRACGANPFARVLTLRHVLLKLLVALCVACMVPWLWMPTLRSRNLVALETTLEWVAAVWMVLYGFAYWRKYSTLSRLLKAIRTDPLAAAHVNKLARRYQILLIFVMVGALGFFAVTDFGIFQKEIHGRVPSMLEYVFAAIGAPAFVIVFSTVSVFYYFICHLHLMHIRLCRHMMGMNLNVSDITEFEVMRAQFALCRDLTKQTAKQYERLLLPFMICLSVDLVVDVVFVAQNASALAQGKAQKLGVPQDVQKWTLAVDIVSILGELTALVLFLIFPALISKAWRCTMLRANEFHMRLTGYHTHDLIDYDALALQGGPIMLGPVLSHSGHGSLEIPMKDAARKIEHSPENGGPNGGDDEDYDDDDGDGESHIHNDKHDFTGIMATWLYRMDFHFKFLDVGITTNFVSSIVYVLLSLCVIMLRVAAQNPNTGDVAPPHKLGG